VTDKKREEHESEQTTADVRGGGNSILIWGLFKDKEGSIQRFSAFSSKAAS